MGHLHVDMGTPEQGLQLVQRLVARLAARGPSPALAVLYMALTQIFYFTSRFSEEVAAAEQAAAVARALRDDRLLAAAHGARGTALETMGHLAEGLQALQEAIRIAESSGELGSPRDIDMLTHTANAAYDSGQGIGAQRYIDRAVDAAERLGDPLYIASSLGHRGVLRVATGDWKGARTDVERAVALYRRPGSSSRSAWVLITLGWLHRLEGAWEEATRELEEALTIAERDGNRLALLSSHNDLAEIEIERGQPSAACARLLPLLDQQDMRRQLLFFVLPSLARAQLELGATSEAVALVTQVVSYARGAGELVLLAEVLWLQARVAIRRRCWVEAEDMLEESLRLTCSLPYPYMEARTLQVYGDLHRHRSEPQQAQEKLEAALAIFRRLGARKDVEQTEHLLTALG
jgi:tetratricopeptide (TPR) repeat protein